MSNPNESRDNEYFLRKTENRKFTGNTMIQSESKFDRY